MVLQPDIFTSYQNMLQILNYPYVLYKREETQDLSNLLNCLNNKLPWMMPSYLFEEFWRVSKNIIQYCFLSIVTLDEWELALTFMLCMFGTICRYTYTGIGVQPYIVICYMDNIQGAIGNPKFTKITDFAADRPTGFITRQFFQVEKSSNFALQLQFKNMFCAALIWIAPNITKLI